MGDEIPVVFLDDRLWRGDCARRSGCRELVETLRLGTGRYRRMKTVYVATTPSELLGLPPAIRRERRFSLAVLDLAAYPDIDAVMEAARTRTAKRGRVTRDVSRARRLGYYVKPFAFAQHVPDIVEIHHSKSERQGTSLSAHYHKTIEELGGAPEQAIDLEPPACPEHHWTCWGVFLRREGHVQGAVRTDEQLVGYIKIRRQGDSASYTGIMGHGAHLVNGIMYLLHFEIVAAMLKLDPERRPRYLVYLNSHPRSTLGEWKRRALFEPRYLHYVDERVLALPEGATPQADQAREALRESLHRPGPHCGAIAQTFGLSLGWLRLLQRAWVIEQSRGPGAVSALLNHGVNAIATLQHLRSELLPLETLDPSGGVSVVLNGYDHGADTLLLLRNANLANVAVYHARPDLLTQLADCYGPAWTYMPWSGDTVLCAEHTAAVIEAADVSAIGRLLGSFSGTVLLALHEAVLAKFGFDMEKISELYEKDPVREDEIARVLAQELNRVIEYKSLHYRCADPGDVFWLCLFVGPRES